MNGCPECDSKNKAIIKGNVGFCPTCGYAEGF